jgi:uncharacterized membrane protein
MNPKMLTIGLVAIAVTVVLLSSISTMQIADNPNCYMSVGSDKGHVGDTDRVGTK